MKNKENSSVLKKIIIVIAIVLAVVLLILLVNNIREINNEVYSDPQYTKINGKYYRQKNIETFLIIGIDDLGTIKGTNSYTNKQQADFIALVVFDKKEKNVNVIHINRDTMLDNDVLGFGDGNYYRTGRQSYEQLALSHTYGDGLESSNLNVRRSVSRLFYGLDIDFYVTLTMDAVRIINDEFGGVTVTMPRDYTDINPKFEDGASVTLSGTEALEFIRARLGTVEPTNTARMERQQIYMDAFIKLIESKDVSMNFASNLYDKLVNKNNGDAYMVTNATEKKLYDTLCNVNVFDFAGVITPAGTVSYAHEFAEFYVDEIDVVRIATELLYTEVGGIQ